MSLVAGVLLRLLLVVDGDDAAAVVGRVGVERVGEGLVGMGMGMATESLKKGLAC